MWMNGASDAVDPEAILRAEEEGWPSGRLTPPPGFGIGDEEPWWLAVGEFIQCSLHITLS